MTLPARQLFCVFEPPEADRGLGAGAEPGEGLFQPAEGGLHVVASLLGRDAGAVPARAGGIGQNGEGERRPLLQRQEGDRGGVVPVGGRGCRRCGRLRLVPGAVMRRHHLDGERHRRAEPGRLRPLGQPFDAGPQHAAAAQRVQREVGRPHGADDTGGLAHGGGDVVVLEVEEHPVAEVRHLHDGVGAGGAVQLEADLHDAEPGASQACLLGYDIAISAESRPGRENNRNAHDKRDPDHPRSFRKE